jgi:hypothetical protein
VDLLLAEGLEPEERTDVHFGLSLPAKSTNSWQWSFPLHNPGFRHFKRRVEPVFGLRPTVSLHSRVFRNRLRDISPLCSNARSSSSAPTARSQVSEDHTG